MIRFAQSDHIRAICSWQCWRPPDQLRQGRIYGLVQENGAQGNPPDNGHDSCPFLQRRSCYPQPHRPCAAAA